ncbi:MAG: Outer membrane porin F precursor [Firmicutes bacterium ADurb.Bin099]|nr:MAG: Outer membrane porin F precursor [Firmicutes bacterium ADurb.Bin099]
MKQRVSYLKKVEPENYWPSFADVMSTMVLIMLFLVLIVFIKNIIISINLDEQEATNIATGAQLEATRNDLAAKELTLQETQLDLETKQTILIMLEEELAAKEISLSLLENELAAKQAALELSEEEATNLQNLILILAEQQAALEAQKKDLLELIALNTIELDSMREQLQKVAVMQVDIFEKVKRSIDEALGPGQVTIGDNGNLMITEGILFDQGKSDLKQSSYALIEKLAKAFEEVLKDSGENIEAIMIEGHASSEGDFDVNQKLSTDRANAVLLELFKWNSKLGTKQYARYFGAVGYSNSRLLVDDIKYPHKAAQNRRIEFSIVVREENVGQIIQEYLDSIDKKK